MRRTNYNKLSVEIIVTVSYSHFILMHVTTPANKNAFVKQILQTSPAMQNNEISQLWGDN